MTALIKEEIIAELKRLGINTSSERNTSLRDYLKYVADHDDYSAF